MRRHFLFPLLALLLLAAPNARADYLQELITEARAARLAADREWLDLGHYRPRLLGGYRSLAVTRAFFNAPEGPWDPEAELEATLAAFFDTSLEPTSHQPHQCRFIARYHWLKSRLHFDPARLPEQACDRFDNWYAAIAPRQMTLVFPAAYINNPSSMFGHTLLRIDNTEQSNDTRLFSYALNFAAATDESNGVVFAVKGLLGGYPGYFSTVPYYEKVKEYNDLENRDIWEYDLIVTPAEQRRMMEHAWELGQVDFDYYFFDENCSYQLLALLDVARPGHSLVDRFHGWAIPSDTVRVTLEEEGLLRDTHYRPSMQTRLQRAREVLTPEERRLTLALVHGAPPAEVSALPEPRQAWVLDTAYDYLQYRFANGDMPRDAVAGPSLALLRQRAKAPASDPMPAPEMPDRPDLGHGTARIAIAGGTRDSHDYAELRVRPAYHDLLDPISGYTPGAEINFLDLRARWWRDRDLLQVDSFRVLEIFSLAPRDEFFSPISWHITTGLERLPLADPKQPPLMPMLNVGGGISYRAGQHGLAFLMVDTLLAAHNDLPNDYSLGAGPFAGFLFQQERTSLLLTARTFRESGFWRWYSEYGAAAGYGLTRNLSLRLELRREEFMDHGITDVTLGLHGYL